jgi:hypothetical protein
MGGRDRGRFGPGFNEHQQFTDNRLCDRRTETRALRLDGEWLKGSLHGARYLSAGMSNARQSSASCVDFLIDLLHPFIGACRYVLRQRPPLVEQAPQSPGPAARANSRTRHLHHARQDQFTSDGNSRPGAQIEEKGGRRTSGSAMPRAILVPGPWNNHGYLRFYH